MEFLEQALQPLPTFSKESSIAGESVGTNPKSPQDEDVSAYEVSSASGSQTGGIQAANASSFPVDVIVYFHMQVRDENCKRSNLFYFYNLAIVLPLISGISV